MSGNSVSCGFPQTFYKEMRLVLLTILFSCSALFADNWVEHNGGASWPTFKYPKSFKIGEDSYKGENFKWVLFLVHPEKELKISVSPYGYVSESSKEYQGFKTPREMVLISELNAGSKVEKKKGYEIFTTRVKGGTKFIFLENNAEWGVCYDSVSFSFPEEERENFKELIADFISHFQPKFLFTESKEETDK